MKNEEVGARIKSRREELNVSVANIAKVTGLSKATIHRYENGEIKNIKLPVIDRIAQYLDVNAMWLMGKSDKKGGYTVDSPHELTLTIDYFIRTLENGEVTINGENISAEKRSTLLSLMRATKIIIEEK